MLGLSSQAGVLRDIAQARQVELSAYVLGPGRLRDALSAAADRGASVSVTLEGRPYARDPHAAAELREQNEATLAELRRHGAVTHLAESAGAPLHLKAALVDRTLYLDDRNWPSAGPDTIVRSTANGDRAAARAAMEGRKPPPSRIAWRKDRALAAEAELIAHASGSRIDCESESFSASPVFRALLGAARSGRHVRLLVSAHTLGAGNRSELRAVRELCAAGAEIRASASDEKLCVTSGGAWVGSANASGGEPHAVDWGLRLKPGALADSLRARFEASWSTAAPLPVRSCGGVSAAALARRR